ncbi:MAG: hypothetical protein V3U29_02220 [Phycisphaeraceae bacterium]
MHEVRNFVLTVVGIVAFIWAFVAWFVVAPPLGDVSVLVWCQRVIATLLLVGAGGWLFCCFKIEDKLPDHLKQVVGKYYYEAGGVSFMPIIRSKKGQAELSVYYQNRYENRANVIIHLRPPEQSFVIRPGMRDVHLAFTVGGGGFGVIHQPIAVPAQIQGEVVEVQLAAASHYPRSRGPRLRRHEGMRCGTLLTDWVGAVFRAGVHEVSGEIELQEPVTLHLSMPSGVSDRLRDNLWRFEQLAAGVE